jgi:hypothetical protein
MTKKPFATEVDLCARFIAGLEKGWTPYAETSGWDILLVRDQDGFQIGIEAKLKLNLDVINQAIEDSIYWVDHAGPDCRAVLVPEGEAGFDRIADYIGITIIRVRPPYEKGISGPVFTPYLPKLKEDWMHSEWHEWCPAKRHTLPEYVPDVAAGSSAPVQLTSWKIAAIKIMVTLEQRGYVTREDFKALKIDHRRWLKPNSWLVVENGRYVRGHMPDFKAQHPKVYEQIAADAPKWMPKVNIPATQLILT